MDVDTKKGEGYKAYFTHKIEHLQVVISEINQDLCRLQAQRNELNAKGKFILSKLFFKVWKHFIS